MNFHALGILLLAIAATFLSSEAALSKKCRRRENGCKAWGTGTNPGLTDDDKQAVVDLHNEYRASVERGEVRGARGLLLPPATDMQTITWDDDLAKMAQDQLDDCRVQKTASKEELGGKATQLLASWPPEKTVMGTIQSVFDHFQSLAEHFNVNMVDSFPGDDNWNAHRYGQLISAKVNRIGCGYDNTMYKGKKTFLLACNYGPAIEANKTVYQRGCHENDRCCENGNPVWDKQLSEDDKQIIIYAHSGLQYSVHRGTQNVSGGELLLPTYMFDMSWSDELERKAQETLNDDCELLAAEDEGDSTNKARIAGTNVSNSDTAIKAMIQGWVDESEHFTTSMVDSFPEGSSAKSFAQMIWQKTKKFGCGYMVRKIGNEYIQKLVCNYSPGLEVGQKVYKTCSRDDKCCTNYKFIVQTRGLEAEEKKAILDLHNDIRRSVAKGEEQGLGGALMPTASNMNKLTWSDDLATLAQRQVDSCEHLEDFDDEGVIGESLRRWRGLPTLNTTTNIVKRWRREARSFSEADIDPANAWNGKVNFIRQMISAETKTIGCGFNVMKDLDEKYFHDFVCHFDPKLDDEGWVYKKGNTGSCCTAEDDGLCIDG